MDELLDYLHYHSSVISKGHMREAHISIFFHRVHSMVNLDETSLYTGMEYGVYMV